MLGPRLFKIQNISNRRLNVPFVIKGKKRIRLLDRLEYVVSDQILDAHNKAEGKRTLKILLVEAQGTADQSIDDTEALATMKSHESDPRAHSAAIGIHDFDSQAHAAEFDGKVDKEVFSKLMMDFKKLKSKVDKLESRVK